MTKRTPAQYEPPPLDFDHAPFDEEALRRILVQARAPVAPSSAATIAACERLNKAAIWLKVQQGLSEAPTEGPARETIRRLRDAAAPLRNQLPVMDDDGLGGAGSNPRVSDGVTRLLAPTMTRLMRERIEREADEHGNGPDTSEIYGAGNAADAFLVLTELLDLLMATCERELEQRTGAVSVKAASPLKSFVQSAGRVYLELTGAAELSLSRNAISGELQGPLIRFLEACCHQVGATEIKRETLADWVQKAPQTP